MKITLVVALAAALGLGGLAGCGGKKKEPAGGGGGTGTGTGTAAAVIDAAAPAVDAAAAVIDAAGPFAMPTNATVVPENQARNVDASALGPAVAVRLVERVEPADGDTRRVGLALVLTGGSAMIVELAPTLDQGDKYTDEAAHLRSVAPLPAPRAFASGDPGHAEAPFKGPLLYVAGYTATEGASDALAIGQDGDALVVWRSEALPEEGEEPEFEAWYEAHRIKLAPGAQLATLK